MNSTRKVIATTEAPAAIGPYSQAIAVSGTMVYVSGQIPLDPTTGSVIGGTIEIQARRVLYNVQAVLKEAGAELKDVVKTTVFLTDMADFAAMNAVYTEFFPENCPARSAVQVARLPKDVHIEIEAIACI